MSIKAFTSIVNNRNEISTFSKETCEPISLKKNGEVDIVEMAIESFKCEEKILSLGEKLLSIRQSRQNGKSGYTLEEFNERISKKLKSKGKVH